MRASKNGIIAPRWCAITLRFGRRVIIPEKTSRAIVALVSYGHPKIVQISYLEWDSAGKSGTSGLRAGCSRMGLQGLAATSNIGRNSGSSREVPFTVLGNPKLLAVPFGR